MYGRSTLNTWYAKVNKSPVWLNLSLNQIIPIEKIYPVWENIVKEFDLFWWNRIVWNVITFDTNWWDEAQETRNILWTEVTTEPADPENDLNPWEFWVNYSNWHIICKWAIPWQVCFKYSIDNSIQLQSEPESTSRYDYNADWLVIYEWYAAVWSDEWDNVWNVRKFLYNDWDAYNEVSAILFSNWTLAKNVSWTDRENHNYS